jgi:D-glycero-D-manno-heptose 1,7-bisphosphate phosphatase
VTGPRDSGADMDKVVVLDRDGTIVVDRHYLSDPDALEFLPGAAAGLRKMSEMGFRLVVITNQSGLARGFFSLSRLQEIHDRLIQMMLSIGAPLAGIYFCPHVPAEECQCRKPNLGLMRQASVELRFDMSKSIVIGDKDSDVEFGKRAGAVTILIGKPGVLPVSSAGPSYTVETLSDAAELIAPSAEHART